MTDFLTDIRYAIRTLGRAPLFAAAVILTLGLGIGANSVVFSMVDAVLLNGLPFPQPNQLVHMQVKSDKGYLISVSLPNFEDWEHQARSFSSIAAAATGGFTLMGRGGAERVQATTFIGDLFGTLGLHPVLGRAPTARETELGAAPTAVLSYGYWQRQFGGSSAVIGSTITLDGQAYAVIGVAPPAMVYPDPQSDLYLPVGAFPDDPWTDRSSSFGLEAVARLRPGVTLAMAQREMDQLAHDIQQRTAYVGTIPVESLRENMLGGVEPSLVALSGAVVLILLIACANIGGLLVARGEGRQHELALRSALGAGTRRLVRQLLTETVILALAGGALGIGIAAVGVHLFGTAFPRDLPVVPPTGVSTSMLAFTAVLTIGTALLFGLFPALRASRAHTLAESLISGGGIRAGDSTQRLRLRGILVTTELALSLVLLVGAGLMLRSVAALRDVDSGFATQGILTMRITPSDATYADSARWMGLYEQIVTRARALPGVTSVGLSNVVPLFSGGIESGAIPDGRADTEENRESALVLTANPGFFPTMGVRLVRGRYFTDADTRTSAPVAIVDEVMAQKFWPGADPIGKRLAWESAPGTPPRWRTVVGVVRNIHYYKLELPARITAYRPLSQVQTTSTPWMYLFVKTNGDPRALASPLRRLIGTLDAEVPVYRVQTMEDVLNQYLATIHLLEQLLSIFAGLAIVLAAVGTYALISYTVARRTHELGIRMALGSTPDQAVRLVMRRGLATIGIGVGCGLVGAVIASRALGASLFGINAFDPAAYILASGLLAMIAVLACWLPARRATRIPPTIALRSE